MDVDMYLFCLDCPQYILLRDFLIKFLQKTLQEKISYRKDYINEHDYTEYIGCSLFSMSIESEFTSEECDLEFTLEEYYICTNVSIYINLFSMKIDAGIELINVMLIEIENKFNTNIIIEDNSSTAVYISSTNKKYCEDSFWKR